MVVQPVVGQMMAATMVGDNRRPPHGVGANLVNWVCVPPNADHKWTPTAAKAMVWFGIGSTGRARRPPETRTRSRKWM